MSGDFKYRGDFPHLVLAAEMREAMENDPKILPGPGELIYIPPNPILSKREQIAAMAMQGLLTGPGADILLRRTDVTFADHAVRIADALLAELEHKS